MKWVCYKQLSANTTISNEIRTSQGIISMGLNQEHSLKLLSRRNFRLRDFDELRMRLLEELMDWIRCVRVVQF